MSFRRNYIQQQGLHTLGIASSTACSMWFMYCKWQTLEALATRFWIGPFSSRIQLSLCLNNKARAKLRCKYIQQLTRIWGGHLQRDGWTIQAPPRVTAHPQVLVLQLWVPMGTCPEHNGRITNSKYYIPAIVEISTSLVNLFTLISWKKKMFCKNIWQTIFCTIVNLRE